MIKAKNLRITNGIRIAACRRLGFRSARSFRYASFPRLTSAQFASPGLATQALIRAGKPSYTWNVMRNTKPELM